MQNYKNHLRLFPAHHFVLLPAILGLFIWSCIHFFEKDVALQDRMFWILVSFIRLLLSMITRIYALKNQDRIIRLEMRQRYLLSLMERAIKENLSNKEIKMAVKNWQADNHRI